MQILITRQPIFDLIGRTAGYEVLSHFENAAAEAEAAPHAAEQLLVDALIGIGLPRLSEDLPVFLPLTPLLAVSKVISALEPQRLFLQLDVRDALDDAIIDGLRALSAHGHKLVFDNWPPRERAQDLLPLANIVKIDLDSAHFAEGLPVCDGDRRIGLLAKNLRERAQVDECLKLGFALFQGPFFSGSTVVDRRDLSVEHVRLFKLMRQVADLSVSDVELEAAFHRDATLAYKLLRIVNSATIGSVNVYSIGHAIRVLGRDALYRWLCLLLLSHSSRDGLKDPRLQQALVRGRTCELIAAKLPQRPAPGPLFLVGMSSALLSVLGLDADEIASYLGLAEPVRDALVSDKSTLGAALALVSAYECGQWSDARTRAAALHMDVGDVATAYVDALIWLGDIKSAA